MKTLYLLVTFFITTQLFANNLAWVDEQIEAIKPPRIGVSEKEISKIKDPFIFLHKDDAEKSQKTTRVSPVAYTGYKKVRKHQSVYLRLNAILNKSAMINGKWYKQGNYIHGYKLAKIKRESVLLTRKNKKVLLSTKIKNKKIKINNK